MAGSTATLVQKATSSSPAKRLGALCLLTAAVFAGCKSKPVPDSTLTENIQSALSADAAIAGQPVRVAVQDGVAILSGSVANDAQRSLAARDAAAVPGVAKVVNGIGVNPPSSEAASVPLSSRLQPPQPSGAARFNPAPPATPPYLPEPHQPAPIERAQPAYNPPPPPPASEPPTPPPAPTFKAVTIASGETIPVRITQTLDSGTTQPDTTFSGVVASDIVIDGLVALPAGTSVSGHVDEVKDAAHFKGSSSLTVSLTAINRRGEHFSVASEPYTVQGKGRGANTAEKTGGGAAVGAILGGIFGGGRGAAIGAAAGAGAGAGSNAITRGQQVQIASESVVRFHLAAPITLKVRTDGGDRHDEDGLRQHP